jgi:ribosomal protein S25
MMAVHEQRIETAALAAAQIIVQHLRGLDELLTAQVVDRAAEIRVIQSVEEIASELKLNLSVKRNWRRTVMSHCVVPKPHRALLFEIALRAGLPVTSFETSLTFGPELSYTHLHNFPPPRAQRCKRA